MIQSIQFSTTCYVDSINAVSLIQTLEAACMRTAIESLGITASVSEAASSLIPAAWGIADDATLSNGESGYVPLGHARTALKDMRNFKLVRFLTSTLVVAGAEDWTKGDPTAVWNVGIVSSTTISRTNLGTESSRRSIATTSAIYKSPPRVVALDAFCHGLTILPWRVWLSPAKKTHSYYVSVHSSRIPMRTRSLYRPSVVYEVRDDSQTLPSFCRGD